MSWTSWAAAAVVAVAAVAVGVAAQQTLMGSMYMWSYSSCSWVDIPQRHCSSYSQCVNGYMQYGDGGSGVRFSPTNTNYQGSVCCPDIVGTWSGGRFYANQAPAFGAPASTVLMTPSSGLINVRFTDGYGYYCTLTYQVTSGVVLGTGVYSSYYYNWCGYGCFWVWLPICLFFVLCCILCCAHPRGREMSTRVIYRGPVATPAPPPPVNIQMNQVPVVEAIPVPASSTEPAVQGVPVTQARPGEITVEYNPNTGKYEQRMVQV